ncbi:class I SAM-dependent methyltransferase [Saccharopolyspora erythraea]|uniref:class I SAM-dependent methyltransferase n=1 Tax=Saccharopolyspora erythraea TaxID=1836 RepID=UPI001BA8A036|nr:class I SAM-dependent methyltransferase [Saccharopolyspora erythraea]QUH03562.1 class I SAM-dependent methyltransferase [Saccharopolyspora erythraea]
MDTGEKLASGAEPPESRPVGPGVHVRVLSAEAPVPADDYGSTLLADFTDVYRRGADGWSREQAMRETLRFVVEALGGEVADRTVLDVGCGVGVDVERMAEMGARSVGLDLVRSAEWDRITAEHPAVGFVQGDLVELFHRGALAEDAFDAVLDNGCMHHQHPDRVGLFFDAMRGVLRAGGVLVTSVFGAAKDKRGALMRNEASRLFRDFTRDELVELGRAHGFVAESVHEVPRDDGLAYYVGVLRPLRNGPA